MGEAVRVKGHCPSCGANRWGLVRGNFDEESSDGVVWSTTHHRIIQCAGCDTVYHQTDMVFSEDIYFTTNAAGEEVYDYEHTVKHWPPPSKRDRPKWVDRLAAVDGDLYRLLTDVYSALEIDLHVLSAIGVRTTFDRGAELLGIDSSLTFAGKLSELASQGFIGSTEKDALAVVTDAGSASAHRGWRPTPEQLDTMLQIIETFVHRNFVLRTDLSELTNAIPVRRSRSSATATAS